MIQMNLGIFNDPVSIARGKRTAGYIRKKNEEINVVLVPLEWNITSGEQKCNHQDIINRLKYELNHNIDGIILDGSELEGKYSDDLDSLDGIAVVAKLKRGDPRYVLIRNKKHRNHYYHSWDNNKRKVLVNHAVRQRGVLNLFDGVECVSVSESIENLIEFIKNDKCEGVVAPADEIRLLKLNNEKELTYDYIDCDKFVPEQGRAILCMLTAKDNQLNSVLKEITSIKSEKEIRIEKEVLKRVNKKPHVALTNCCICTVIERSRLNIYVDLEVKEHSFRLKESGDYAERLLIIRRLSDKIGNIVEF